MSCYYFLLLQLVTTTTWTIAVLPLLSVTILSLNPELWLIFDVLHTQDIPKYRQRAVVMRSEDELFIRRAVPTFEQSRTQSRGSSPCSAPGSNTACWEDWWSTESYCSPEAQPPSHPHDHTPRGTARHSKKIQAIGLLKLHYNL